MYEEMFAARLREIADEIDSGNYRIASASTDFEGKGEDLFHNVHMKLKIVNNKETLHASVKPTTENHLTERPTPQR